MGNWAQIMLPITHCNFHIYVNVWELIINIVLILYLCIWLFKLKFLIGDFSKQLVTQCDGIFSSNYLYPSGVSDYSFIFKISII